MESYLEPLAAATNAEPAPPPKKLPKSKRGWQLEILAEMDLPKGERSRDGRPVKPVQLGAVLKAIDNRAREHGWYFREREELRKEAKLDSLRQLDRCIEVLKRKGWVESREETLRSGARLCHYRIVFQDLCRLTTLPLWDDACSGREGHLGDNSGTEPVAQLAEPVAQIAYPVAQLAEPVAHAGNPRSAPVSAPPVNAPKAPTDETGDGARCFSPEEQHEIRRYYVELQKYVPCGSNDDKELLLKLATLVHDDKLSDDAYQQLIESFELRTDRLRNAISYLWGVMRNQCAKHGGPTFDKLLATTDFPRCLLRSSPGPLVTLIDRSPRSPAYQQPATENLRTTIIKSGQARGLSNELINTQLIRAGFGKDQLI